MSNETKRDVFEDALFDLENPHPKVDPQKMLDRYLAALPDDLPVIPKGVGEYIKVKRAKGLALGEVICSLGCKSFALMNSDEFYIVLSSEKFARAWVLGVWCVEETGEIVKLEEEK